MNSMAPAACLQRHILLLEKSSGTYNGWQGKQRMRKPRSQKRILNEKSTTRTLVVKAIAEHAIATGTHWNNTSTHRDLARSRVLW